MLLVFGGAAVAKSKQKLLPLLRSGVATKYYSNHMIVDIYSWKYMSG